MKKINIMGLELLELTNQEYLFAHYNQFKITTEHRGRMMDNLKPFQKHVLKSVRNRAEVLINKHKQFLL